MGSQYAKLRKTPLESSHRQFLSKHGKCKKSKENEDRGSMSSLDLINSTEGAATALYTYEPPPNACGSAIAVQKDDSLWVYGQNTTGEWLDIMCRRTGERGWIPTTCVFDPTITNLKSSASMNSSDMTIESHVSCTSLLNQRWYHGAIHRSYAEYLLNSGITGSFLVRESESSFGKLTVSLRSDGRIFHYRICTDENNQFYINETRRFATVLELVQHHEKTADGLACPLLYGVSKKDRSLGYSSQGLDSDYDAWEINRTDIIMKHKLGSGQYGVVYEALFKPYDVTVAVKTLKEDITLRDEFLQEARLMKGLRHPNLVRLLGVCTQEPPYYIITEFMCNGNLLDYLRSQPREELSPPVLLEMAIQVSRAMTYLEEHNCIHRDLAARNCLVGESNLIKVADFGLARCMECDMTYKAREGAKFPIKWTAPEGLVYNVFSIKSDVWAFGVLLWEIATYGATPYPGVELQDVYVLLEKGTRMEPPQGCPDAVYRLMIDCWSWDSDDRPSFKDVGARLETISNSLDINAAVEHELQRHRIRMPPPPPKTPPPSSDHLAHRRNSSLERFDKSKPLSMAQMARRGHADSFTAHDSQPRATGAAPSGATAQPGNRFSEILTSFPPPPPPLTTLPSNSHAPSSFSSTTTAGAGEGAEMASAGSLGRRKAVPPAPPMRTTTLRVDEHLGRLQVNVGTDSQPLGLGHVTLDGDHLPSPPNPCHNWQPLPGLRHSPPYASDIPSVMTTSATFGVSPTLGGIRRATAAPTPPQRSESARSHPASSSQRVEHPRTPPQPHSKNPSPLKSNKPVLPVTINGPIDFQSELSSRLKRQLENSTKAAGATTPPRPSVPQQPQQNISELTAEMIMASKSKLKTVAPMTTPEVPAPSWKDAVVQRRLKNAEASGGSKRMSWTPTSNNNPIHTNSNGHAFKLHPPNVETFQEDEEEVEEAEEVEGDMPAMMSQSVSCLSSASSMVPLSYEALLKQVTDLCADLNLAKVNLPSDSNCQLMDRIEELKRLCLDYVAEVDCSAHAKFRFRDECARLHTAAENLRSVCGAKSTVPGVVAAGVGRRKVIESVYTTIEGIHQSILRLTPPSTSSATATSEVDGALMSTGVAS